jgi:ATP-dependent protease ClpP protease subunit
MSDIDIWYSKAEKKDKKKDDDDYENTAGSDSKDRVEAYNNDIYFYAEVKRTNNLTLNKKIVETANKYSNISNSLNINPSIPINLHINSYGGSVFAGFSSVDYILQSKAPITTIIDGCAASAATIMSVVGAHRKINKNAYMLIHQLSSGMWGKYEELKDDMKNSEILMKRIREIYEERTKIPAKKLNEILKHDLWWDAETCLKYGLVDEIIY